ncbi:unnamed protein product [Lactuca virosa]|uniref:UPF0261 domain-containing protein n=1 Tax=Lactuca virosa TaxID=75947 RepID=A0AAU9MCT3_9ASTR|nr:unnamed protein product [Lactuca virosa]
MFKGSGIKIIIRLGNEFLRDISTSQDRAVDWLKINVEPFIPGTRIRGITVENEVRGGGDQELWEVLLPTVKNIHTALDLLHLADDVEASSPHSTGVFASSFHPSVGALKETLVPYMKPLLEFFSQIKSPFYINTYPFLAYISDPEHTDINYAVFKKNAGIKDAKTKLHYDNMFEAKIDATYAALEKAGFEKMEVIVLETGWASKGDANEAGATLSNARTYNLNLRKRLLKKKDTPYRPKMVVKAYIFAMFNENLQPGPTSERNFGLFKADGSISYNIGFTRLVPSSATSLFSFKIIEYTGEIDRPPIADRIEHLIYNSLVGPGSIRLMGLKEPSSGNDKFTLGLTMFGVTNPCVNVVKERLNKEGYETLFFHATRVGGRAMEDLGVLDITTTEVANHIVGCVLACEESRFDAIIEKKIPFVLSVGALDMVNFGPKNTIPTNFQQRKIYEHNKQVLLMRTTVEENKKFAAFIAQKLNKSSSNMLMLQALTFHPRPVENRPSHQVQHFLPSVPGGKPMTQRIFT